MVIRAVLLVFTVFVYVCVCVCVCIYTCVGWVAQSI